MDKDKVKDLWENFPKWMHGLAGISHTGARGESVKGFFGMEDQTAYGYRAIVERMEDNIRRHGWNPHTGAQESTPEHIRVWESLKGVRLSDREADYLRGYLESYGEVFAPQVKRIQERL